MYDDIQNPPQQLSQSKFKAWFWLLILPLYLFACLWALKGSALTLQDILITSNISTLSLIVIIFALVMLVWLGFELIKGFSKLAECSKYEVYLAEVFENRDRQRPTQNAMRLDYLRKLRKMNSKVRGATENKQKQLLGMAIIGLLVLLTGCIGQLVSQFIAS